VADEKVESERADNKTEKNVGVTEKGKGKNKVEEPEDSYPGKVGHMGMTGNGAESLIRAPDAKK